MKVTNWKSTLQAWISYSSAFLHTLHLDVWGPTPTTSYDGFRFYFIIVDEFSRYIWQFSMVYKFDVASIFLIFLKMLRNQYHTCIKVVQSNGAGEFVNHSLKSYFTTHGLIHHLSCPRTPQQNGMVERRHCYIINIGLTLIYGLLICASSILDNCIPNNCFFYQPPTNSHPQPQVTVWNGF